MAKTRSVTLNGHVAWAKLYEPETAFGATRWKLDFYPENDAELTKFKNTGSQKKIKENTNPDNNVPLGKHFSLTRDTMKVIKGEVVNFTGPIVTNEDGTVVVDFINTKTNKRAFSYKNEEKGDIVRRGVPVNIGNGSKVAVTISVYDTQKGPGHRLESIKILELVEFAGGDGELPPVANDVTTPVGNVSTVVEVGNTDDDESDEKAPW